MSEQPPQYQVGQIVNGHRWTGSVWEPVMAEPGPLQAEPIGTPSKESWYKKWWGIGLLAFGALVLIGAIFGGGGDDTEASDQPVPTETAAPEESTAEEPAAEEPAAEGPTAGIGDPVRDGKFEFTVTSVKTGVSKVGNDYANQKAQGEYTLVSMKIENIGEEAQTFFSDNVKGIDSKDRELSSDSTATLYANQDSTGWIEEINPGNSVEAVVVFDVAEGEKLVVAQVHDSAFSGGSPISLN